MSENQKGGLENLAKGLGIDSEAVDKVVDAANDVVGKVDLDKVGKQSAIWAIQSKKFLIRLTLMIRS